MQGSKPEWRNGRRDALKMRCLRACGFDSHLRYKKMAVERSTAIFLVKSKLVCVSRCRLIHGIPDPVHPETVSRTGDSWRGSGNDYNFITDPALTRS